MHYNSQQNEPWLSRCLSDTEHNTCQNQKSQLFPLQECLDKVTEIIFEAFWAAVRTSVQHFLHENSRTPQGCLNPKKQNQTAGEKLYIPIKRPKIALHATFKKREKRCSTHVPSQQGTPLHLEVTHVPSQHILQSCICVCILNKKWCDNRIFAVRYSKGQRPTGLILSKNRPEKKTTNPCVLCEHSFVQQTHVPPA